MPSTRDIRRRIRSVRNTQQITKAMKMVAASKLRKAQSRLMGIRPYEQAIARAVQTVVARLSGDEHPLLETRPVHKRALIIINGDKGLSGAFNHNIIRRAETLLQEDTGHEFLLTAIGKKAARHFLKLGREPSNIYTGLSEAVTYAEAAAIMHKHVAAYVAGEFDTLDIVYTYFQSAISQQVRSERLLPFPGPDATEPVPVREVYLMEPSPEAVADYLLEESLNIRLFRALLENASSEHGARMTGMDNATKNAEEIIGSLTLQLNRARQAMITREIAEIVGGADALGK
jgi:F-type H+-transporting ATPase subunit gamma